jgi:hypothetical protein
MGELLSTKQGEKEDVLAVLLNAHDLAGTGLTAEKALFAHGMIQNSVEPRSPDLFFSEFTRFIELYPRSPLVADALYQIAAEQLFATPPDIDQALSNFAKLRGIEGAMIGLTPPTSSLPSRSLNVGATVI